MKKVFFLFLLAVFSFLSLQEKVYARVSSKIIQTARQAVVSVFTASPSGGKKYLGDGFIVNEKGVVATSYKVAYQSSRISIELQDGSIYPVKGVTYYSPKKDLILLKTSAPGLFRFELDDSSLKVGDVVYSFSSLLEDGFQANIGVVSAIEEEKGLKLLKFTASGKILLPGGPLINAEGKVGGIILESAGSRQDFNLALSSKHIKPYINNEPKFSFSEFKKRMAKADRYLKKAAHAYSSGQYRQAIDLTQEFLAINPDRADAYNLLGLSFYKIKNYRQSIKNYQEALKINPADTSTHLNLAIVYLSRGQKEKAIDSYRKVLDLEPNSLQAWHGLSRIYVDLEKYEEALACYLRILELDPGNIEIYSDLGWVYAAIGDYQKSISYFKKYGDHHSDDPEVYFKIGLVYYESKDMPAARKKLFKAKELAQEQGRIQLLQNITKVLPETEE